MLVARCAFLLQLGLLITLRISAQSSLPLIYQATLGTGEQGATNLELDLPSGMCLGQQNTLLVADRGNNRIQVYDSAFEYLTTLEHDFSSPADIAQGPNGTLYVADRYHDRIQIFDSAYQHLGELSNVLGHTPHADFNDPVGVALDAQGNIYVADYRNDRIQIFSNSLDYLGTLAGSSQDPISKPTSVCVDPRTQDIIVADYGNDRVLIYDKHYQLKKTLGGATSVNAELFTDPYGVVVDKAGVLYVSDQKHRVQAFNRLYEPLFSIGTGRIGTNDSTLKYPAGLAVDALNRLYIADFHNHRVQVFTPPAPEVRLSSSASEWTNEDYSLRFTFNKEVVGFSAQRIRLTNAVLSPLNTTDSIVFQAVVSPLSDGQVAVEVPAGAVLDHRGVANPQASLHQLTFDTHPPRVELIPTAQENSFADTLLLTLSLSEQTTGIDPAAIKLHNASLDTLLAPDLHFERLHWGDELSGGYDLAVDSRGRLFVTVGEHYIQIYDENLVLEKIIGGSHTPELVLKGPQSIFLDQEDRLYMAEPDSFRVRVFDDQQNLIRTFYPGRLIDIDQGYVGRPRRITRDSKGTTFLIGKNSNYIQVFDQEFNYLTTLGDLDQGGGNDRFKGPRGMTVDQNDYLYVADQSNNRVQIYDSALQYHATLETPSPYDVSVDQAGNIYVVSFFRHSLRTFNQAHELIDVIGTDDQLIPEGTFHFPRSVVHNDQGDVYVMDTYNREIEKYTNAADHQLVVRRTTPGPMGVTIKAGTIHDLAGNTNEQTVSHFVSYPTPPTLTLSTAQKEYINEPLIVRVSANEPVSGFDTSDVVLQNATLSTITTTDSLTFTLQVTPNAEGEVRITIPQGAVSNPYGYTNDEVLTYRVVYDTVSPSVRISSVSEDSSNQVSINFSEPVRGFTLDELHLRHGAVMQVSTEDSVTFIATLTQTDHQQALVYVLAGAVRDAAGNLNQGSDTLYLPAVALPPPLDTLHAVEIRFAEADATYFPATVHLYHSADQRYSLLLSQQVSSPSDSVWFDELLQGVYTIGIQPDDTSRLSSYYRGQLILAEANSILIQQDTSVVYHFPSLPSSPAIGSGTLSGVLVSDSSASNGRIMIGTSSAQGEPLSGVATYLLIASSHQLLARSITNQHGAFSFTNLPAGEYIFRADYQGLPMESQSSRITIGANGDAKVVTVVAGSTIKIIELPSAELITAVQQTGSVHQIHHYPNPVSDALRIDHPPEWLGGTIDVVNALGEIIETHPITERFSTVRFDRHDAGFYVIVLTRNEQRVSFRVLRQ